MSTLILTHPVMELHSSGPGHPEQPARLPTVVDAIAALSQERMSHAEAEEVAVEHIKAVHDPAFVDMVLETIANAKGPVRFDADTGGTPHSAEAARRATGAVCQGVDWTVVGKGNAFAAVRPPGHHAERATAMGFCLFGSVAIAAQYARKTHGMKRVAVVDFDVHHGNGSQDLLWNDPDTLFVSSHQMPLYPGSGAPNERGAHGQILNLPLAAGDGTSAWQASWKPALDRIRAFEPDLILVSAGFDAHAHDPLAGLSMVEDDFAWLTEQLAIVAKEQCQGRLVSALEGGYNLDALASSVSAHVSVLNDYS